ncbi:hypothetical protein [Antarctobacter jejuensis]|uniref:hypothetical protein n=1 Tax=Antarctobacter jejuensis TaxID=1439938 RepID=UPI003FD64F3F
MMVKTQRFTGLAALLGLAGLATGVMAQDQTDPVVETAEPACELKGENGMVSMLLCPAGLDSAAYADEGRIACEARAPCGAWIWINADAVPEEAPDAHDKLPKESVRQAVAIWINDKQELMVLKKEAAN